MLAFCGEKKNWGGGGKDTSRAQEGQRHKTITSHFYCGCSYTPQFQGTTEHPFVQ